MSTELYPPMGPSPDPYWATQTTWYVDPAQTFGGNDRNTGLAAAKPLKSIAEWRSRVKGANFDNVIITIHALSSSTVEDDGIFTGFTTRGSGQVVLIGTTSVVKTGSVTGYTAYAGNVRGQLVDAAIPVSWTASDCISTTSGSRYIRKTGTFKQAPLIKDLGANTVMIGLPVTVSETDTSAFPDVTVTDFVIGESYEVVTRTRWPELRADSEAFVRYQCLDCTPGTSLAGIASASPHIMRNHYVLCGFLGAGSVALAIGIAQADACVFTGSGFGSVNQFTPRASAFVGCVMQFSNAPANLNTNDNVFVGTDLRVWHGGMMASSGTLRIFDTTVSCLSVRHRATVNLQGLIGGGNTGKLVLVDGGSQVYGGATATAATTDANPFQVTGVSGAAPFVDAASGDGIYT